MNRLLLILITFPLLAIAGEVVVSPAYLPLDTGHYIHPTLDLTYNLPIDPNYCDNNPPECQPLPNILPKFEMVDPTTNLQWTTFWALQLLDVYSTSRAVKYDCIKEVNPLFTDTPGDLRLVATKTLLLAPALLHNDYWKTVTPAELEESNMIYTFIVANNFRLLDYAKTSCNKR